MRVKKPETLLTTRQFLIEMGYARCVATALKGEVIAELRGDCNFDGQCVKTNINEEGVKAAYRLKCTREYFEAVLPAIEGFLSNLGIEPINRNEALFEKVINQYKEEGV